MENETVVNSKTTVVEVPAKKEEKIPVVNGRIGVTKKIYRPDAEKKARKLAKKRRQQNRRRN